MKIYPAEKTLSTPANPVLDTPENDGDWRQIADCLPVELREMLLGRKIGD